MSLRVCVLVALLSLIQLPLRSAPLPEQPAARGRITPQELAQGYRQNLVIAKPRASVREHELGSAESALALRRRSSPSPVDQVRMLELVVDDDPVAAAERLLASGLYEYVEPDYLRRRQAAPNDPRFGEQWALRNTGQAAGKVGADAAAVLGWDTRNSASGVIVAVLDTGIRATHEDLAANLWVNPGEIPGNGTDDDGNGYVDDVHGINSLVDKGTAGSGNPADDEGHGTAVAGVVGAVGNNDRGISGVAWQVKLMPLKIDNRDGGVGGGAFASNIVECIDYAISQNAHIINISYGGPTYSQAEVDAIKRARDKGIVVVAAAGNSGFDTETSPSYPASYPVDNIVSVANSDRHDVLSVMSTYGGLVELAAPGTDILTCGHMGDAEYKEISGTSFSAPLVAGSLALLRAQFPDDSARGSINRLLRSVDMLPSFSGLVMTGGRLNLAKALTSTSQRPFNDDFSGRARIHGEAVATRGASAHATSETGEPTHGAAGGASLWWTWTATRTGTVVVDTNGSAFDTLLAVYTGDAVSQLSLVASNDDAPGRTSSRLTFPATQGTTYHLAVDGKGGATGYVELAVALTPPNDSFGAATTVSGLTAMEIGTNLNATREEGEPLLSDPLPGMGATVWYRWTAPRTGVFSATVWTERFVPLVGVYSGAAVSSLELLDGGDYAASFPATAGTTYHFAVDSGSGRAGTFTFTLLESYWVLPYGRSISSSVAIAPDYSVSMVDDDGYLLTLTSEDYWERRVRGDVDVGTPALAPDRTVYVTTTRGLFAYSRTGDLKWEKLFDQGVSGSPAVAADGTIYVHADGDGLHAFDIRGGRKWRTSIPGVSYASPSIGSDGTIYLGSDNHSMYAVAPTDGRIKWRFDAKGEIFASAAVGSDDTIYFGTLSGEFYAVSSGGSSRWVHAVGSAISSSAAIGADGTIYFGAYDGKLYALTGEGVRRWTYSTGGDIRGSSPAVASNGTIYIGSYDGKVHAVTLAGNESQAYQTAGAIRSSPAIKEGEVIFGSSDGNLYFLFPGYGAANSPWPMHRQNAARTGRRSPATAPVIHAEPTPRTVAVGGSTTLVVNANGEDQLAFQWYLDGVAIAGATESSYEVRDATASSAGHYTVSISNARGSITSAAAEVKVVNASNVGRIINLSTRALAGSGSKTLIVGMAVGGGGGQKDLLIRGAGPTLGLAPYNVPGTISDPKLTLFSGQTSIATNDNWGGVADVVATSKRVGAFDYSSTASKDAALVTQVSPGNYSAHITAADNSTGVALAEFYDATEVFTAGAPRLVNVSARADVGRGADVLIVGFVITGDTPCKLLIRGVGPTLALPQYGVEGVLIDPKLEVRNGAQVLVASNDNWGAGTNIGELEAVMNQAGAFALPLTSKDAALVVTLEPGLYSAVISGVADTTGVALAEVYQVE